MTSINQLNNGINRIVKVKFSDERKLDLLAKRSRRIMREYPNVFKSETLEKLYTDEFLYEGRVPNGTYVMNKRTKKPVLMHISKKTNSAYETYTGYNMFGQRLGKEKFSVVHMDEPNKNYMMEGYMKSYANEKYAGTQIRMTQVKVERAMQENINYIPLYSLPEALPFHSMMGFLPEKGNNAGVQSYNQLNKLMDALQKKSEVPPHYYKPILNKENNKYYLDFNRTHANATLNYLKDYIAQTGKKMESDKLMAPDVIMSLEGKNLEIWKQRALSQPILLKKTNRG